METSQNLAESTWIALDRHRGIVWARIAKTPLQTAESIARAVFPAHIAGIVLVPWHHADWWEREKAKQAPIITPEVLRPKPVAWNDRGGVVARPAARPKHAVSAVLQAKPVVPKRQPVERWGKQLARHFAKVGRARL